jgi:hypothetical protein
MPARTQPPLSPADRRRELASILAVAIIRRHRRSRDAAPLTSNSSEESSPSGLELSARLPLSVARTRG